MKVTYRQVRAALDELNVIVESQKQTPKVDRSISKVLSKPQINSHSKQRLVLF